MPMTVSVSKNWKGGQPLQETQLMRRSNLILATAFLALGGCSDALNPASTPQTAQLRVEAAVVSAAVSTLVIEVTAPDIATPLAFNLQIQNGTASGTISIPAGASRTITMHAFDANGIETHRGSVTRDILPGTNATINIRLNPIAGDQPIDIQVGSTMVTVNPASVSLRVGDTSLLTALLTDVTGNMVTGTVLWATLDPGIAIVDSNGLVTARGAGSVKIVATFNGVGASSVVTVTP
jgi:hypothetical protein